LFAFSVSTHAVRYADFHHYFPPSPVSSIVSSARYFSFHDAEDAADTDVYRHDFSSVTSAVTDISPRLSATNYQVIVSVFSSQLISAFEIEAWLRTRQRSSAE